MTCTQPSARLKRHLRQAMNNAGSTSELVTLLSCLIAASSTDAALNMQSFGNGSIVETIDVDVTSDGAVVTLSLQAQGGGNLTVQLSTNNLIYTAGSVALTPGTDTSPTLNYVCIIDVGGVATLKAGTVRPAEPRAPVATVLCQSAASIQADGPYKVHVWTDHMSSLSGQGHLSHINRWVRSQHATWLDGGDLALSIDAAPSPDTVDISVAAGFAFQLHDHTFPAFDTSTGSKVYVVNDSVAPLTPVTDLETLLTDSLGASMTGRYFSLVIWVAVSEDEDDCKLMCNLPGGSYQTQTGVENDADNFANFRIPADFRGVGILLAELKLQHRVAAGGQHIEVATVDLRGLLPTLTAGGGAASGSEFITNVFRILDNIDPTKKLALDVSAITTALTRTITMPDEDITLGVVTHPFGAASAARSTTSVVAFTDKISVVIPAFTGRAIVHWSAILDTNDVGLTSASARLQNDTDAATIDGPSMMAPDPGGLALRQQVGGTVLVTMAGVAKTISIEFASGLAASIVGIRSAQITGHRLD